MAASAADKYERLALIEAGWDPAAAALACQQRAASARPPAAAAAAARGARRAAAGGGSGAARARPPAAGPRKTDRVARWRELQSAWDRDRFLRAGAAGKGGARRPPVGFNAYFSAAHAEAEDERRAALASGRGRGL